MSKLTLLDALNEERTQYPPRCAVHILLDKMSPDDAATLRNALALSLNELPNTKLWNACRKAGHEIGIDSISRHRRGTCRCQ